MTLQKLVYTTSTLSLILAGSAFAEGGVAVAPPAPVLFADPGEFAYVELFYSNIDLSQDADNDADFDGSGIPSVSGQALLRFDNVIVEIQGNIHGDLDGGSGDETSSSFGAFGHYLFDVGPGELGAFAGITGGQHVEDDEGNMYGLIGAEYAMNGFVVAAAYAQTFYGDQDGEAVSDFYYLQAGYDYQFNDQWSLGVDGYVGAGSTFNSDNVTFHELNAQVNYDLSSNIRLFAGASLFSFESDQDPGVDAANGYQLNLGVSFAIGGGNSAAREAIPFDTPMLHRETTWGDEAL